MSPGRKSQKRFGVSTHDRHSKTRFVRQKRPRDKLPSSLELQSGKPECRQLHMVEGRVSLPSPTVAMGANLKPLLGRVVLLWARCSLQGCRSSELGTLCQTGLYGCGHGSKAMSNHANHWKRVMVEQLITA